MISEMTLRNMVLLLCDIAKLSDDYRATTQSFHGAVLSLLWGRFPMPLVSKEFRVYAPYRGVIDLAVATNPLVVIECENRNAKWKSLVKLAGVDTPWRIVALRSRPLRPTFDPQHHCYFVGSAANVSSLLVAKPTCVWLQAWWSRASASGML